MTTFKIDGMKCANCTGKVSKALNSIEGVVATVSLADGAAYVESVGIADNVIKEIIEKEGYTVVSVE